MEQETTPQPDPLSLELHRKIYGVNWPEQRTDLPTAQNLEPVKEGYPGLLKG